MSFTALMLLKNREAVFHRANSKKGHFKFGDGIYVISEVEIQNIKRGGKIHGAEAIYFEGNPNAIKPKKAGTADASGKYLDEIVILNALKQTGSAPRYDFGSMFAFLAPLKDPVNLMYYLFFAVILYGVIAQAMGWV